MPTPVNRLAATVAATTGALAVTFGAAAPPEHCPSLTPSDVRVAAESAAGWIVDNQRSDGRWLYEYDRGSDTISDDYNVVRHAGVMTSLYQAGARGIEGATESADRGLEWALANLVERDDWAGMTTSQTIQAGTNALLLAGLVERRLATGDPVHDDTMVKLARFLEDQVEPSGALLAYYDLGPDRARPETYSIYYTGEAYWALGRLHRVDPDAGWGDTADRMGAYMATVRDDVEDIWPPLADHWSGYGLSETAAFPDRDVNQPLTDDEIDFVRRQGGLIGQRVRSISQRFGPWGVAVRGTFTPRGGGYGVFGEGLTGLWRAAQLDDRLADERGPLAERATCIVGLAVEAQSDAADAAEYSEPGMVEGAWFIDDVTRMDDQQHALSALLLTIPILETGLTSEGHTTPSAWLWLLVVIAVVNPARIALSMPRGRSRTDRVQLAAIGGGLGALGLFAVGALSGGVLDLADTSRPAMRLAAGGLCLLSVAIDLARSPSSDEPVLAGRRAAIVPVAVPLVVRPALIIAGWSVVADHGLPPYLLALATTIALLVVAAAMVDAERPVVATWLARVLSTAGGAAAILLIAHAVFDI